MKEVTDEPKSELNETYQRGEFLESGVHLLSEDIISVCGYLLLKSKVTLINGQVFLSLI